jgi:hypothetical protein
MAQDLLTQPILTTTKSHSTIQQGNFVPGHKRKVNFFDLLKGGSYTIIGYKKSKKSTYDFRLRSKKTYVQKVFLELVNKFSDEQIQKLLYLDLYQDVCNETRLHLANYHVSTNPLHCPASPYFVQGQKFAKSKHSSIKTRFLKMAQKRGIQVQAKDPFQLACTLQFLWEQAVRIVEQQKHVGSHLFAKADALVTIAKQLPDNFSPFEEKKTLVHISTFKMPAKSASRKLKADEKLRLTECIERVLRFGYEYYGLHASYLKTHI